MSTTEKNTISYKEMELPCIDSGYWPDGVTLIGSNTSDLNKMPHIYAHDRVCLCNGRAFSKDGSVTIAWKYWAILPPKPAARRLTNREVYALWRKGWYYKTPEGFIREPGFFEREGDTGIEDRSKLRAPNTDEWLEPTTDLLEVV